MRRRGPVALWLLVRSGGAARVDMRALSATQRAQLAGLAGLTDRALAQGFGGA
jgi:hypothetical protein